MNTDKIIGFTLIEVLIALAIFSIALTAIIKASSQNIRDTAYLQDKSIATFVTLEVINEIRVGLLKIESSPLESQSQMLGQVWNWHATQEGTPNPHISKITVSVNKESDEKILQQMVTYVFHP